MSPEVEICAGGAVIKGGKLVILKRKNGVWLMPKGHVDPGETIAEAAGREVKEETGLEVKIGPELGITEYSHSEDGRLHRKKVYWFYMEAAGGELKPEDGIFTEAALISEDQIETLSFPHDRELAKEAFARYKKRRFSI